MALLIFPESSRSFCAGTYQSHFWTLCACSKERNMQICSWKYSVHAWKTQSKKSFSGVSWKEHCIHEAASRIGLQNQGAICVNISCSRESMAKSIDRAPSKPSPAKRRRFQMFKKAFHEKWPFITIDGKGDTCVNSEVRSTFVKWLDWRPVECNRQKQCSQMHRISMVDCPVIFP